MGHIGERGDSGSWDSFEFEVLDTDGEQHTITIDTTDFEGMGIEEEEWWHELFDFLDFLADEYDVDYDNEYGEAE